MQTIAVLESRISGLETALTDLHAQMLASSELIKALADQNGAADTAHRDQSRALAVDWPRRWRVWVPSL